MSLAVLGSTLTPIGPTRPVPTVAARARLAGLLCVLCLATFATFASGAQAEFMGTPGKIAYLDGHGATSSRFPLKIWDPAAAEPRNPGSGITTPVASTFHFVEAGKLELVNGEASTPVFSPDGTKIAYSALVPDPGVHHEPGYHTAIFVMNADGSGQHEVTEPYETLEPPPECEEDCPEHIAADYMPAWSPDGKTIAFVREVEGSEYDTLYPEHGLNIWTVPASGGAPGRLTNGADSIVYDSVVWGAEGMIAAFVDSQGQHLGLIPQGANAPVVIASPTAAHEALDDYDVSPDGKSVTYTTTGANGMNEHVVGIDGRGNEVLHSGLTTTIVRYSNTGSGPLRIDCKPRVGPENAEFEQCGLFEEHTPDPGGDLRSDEPPNKFMLPWVDFGGVVNSDSPTRTLWDVQAQQLPVVFVPGFLGSEITGCGGVQWFSVPPDLEGMRLGPDGETNDGCPSSEADGKVVKFYENTAAWIKSAFGSSNTLFGCERANVLGWDWRKAPKPNLTALDEKVTEALERDACAEKEGAKRVVIMAHSYGGLLTRAYVDEPEYAKRVARVLTVGTPYWGSPKSIFPPAFGIEMPYNKDNLIFPEAELKTFAGNLAGMMQLFPSNSYGPWLKVNGESLGGIGAQPFIASIGASSSLFGQAQANHDSVYDHFFTDYGQIDYRQVAGTGLATVGSVEITGKLGHEAKIHMNWVNGDGTVPATAAATGPIGSQPPDTAVHIQDICGIEHMEETEYDALRSDYFEFLDHGSIPLKSEGACPFTAHLLDIANSSGTLGPPSTHVARARGTVAVAGGGRAMTLEEADAKNLIQLYAFPGDTQALLDEARPVTIGGDAKGLTITITALGESGEGPTLRYGPLSGALEIGSGEDGVRVTLNGEPVAGTPLTGPGEEGTGGNSDGGGSSTSGGAGGPRESGSTSSAPVGKLALRKIKVTRRRAIRLTLEAPGKGALAAKAKLPRPKKSRKRRTKAAAVAYGSARAAVSQAGPVTLTIKPGARARATIAKAAKTHVTLSISFQPATGSPQKLSAKATIPRLRGKRHRHRHRGH